MAGKREWPLLKLADELDAWSETVGRKKRPMIDRLSLHARTSELARSIIVSMELQGLSPTSARIERSLDALRGEARAFDKLCKESGVDWIEYDQARASLQAGAIDLASLLRKIHEETQGAAGERRARADVKAESASKRKTEARSGGKKPKASAADNRILLQHALLAHHRVDTDEPNWEPASQAALAETLDWSQSTVSRTMAALFGKAPMHRYRRLCRQDQIIGFLKRHDDGSSETEAIDPHSLMQ